MKVLAITMGIITGTFRQVKVGASWKTDDGIIQGFAIPRKKNGAMYVDTDKNGKLDLKKDDFIAKVRPAKTAGEANIALGTWSVDPSTWKGSFVDPNGIEFGIIKVTDTSFF